MKKVLTMLFIMSGCTRLPAFALTFEDVKSQIVDQTYFTARTDGGVAGFYDLSVDKANANKAGFVDHVITNAFLQADVSWIGTSGKDGILGGGVSLRWDKLYSTIFPTTSAIIKVLMPPVLQKLYCGTFLGWSVTDGVPHWGFSLGYDF